MTKYTHIANLTLSPDVAALNPDLIAKPQPKTEARKDLDKEIRENFARQFETVWQRCGGPELIKEFKFCEERNWRADYKTGQCLIELDGGVYSNGRHTRGSGYIEDCIKLNTATMLGYRVLRIPTGCATDTYLSQIIKFLQNA